MDKLEALQLIQSIDSRTLATAKALMTTLLNAMKGGRWDEMTTGKKILLIVAIAIKYGERRGTNGKKEPAGTDAEL